MIYHICIGHLEFIIQNLDFLLGSKHDQDWAKTGIRDWTMCGTKGKKTMCTPPRIGCFIAKSKGLGWLFDSWVLAFCMACHWKSIFSETQMCYGGDMKVATAWFLQMAGPREFQDSKNCHLIDLM